VCVVIGPFDRIVPLLGTTECGSEKPHGDSRMPGMNPSRAGEVRGEAETILKESISVVSLTATVTRK
jgi:hypothetical protein